MTEYERGLADGLQRAAVLCDATADRLRALADAKQLSSTQHIAYSVECAADAIRSAGASGVKAQEYAQQLRERQQ